MRAANVCSSLALLVIFCTGCWHRKTTPPPQAQAPPLQTGKGTLSPPKTAQTQEKTDTPLASPLPPPSAQSVPLPPPPPPKKVHRVKRPPKPPDTAQAPASPPAGAASQPAASGTQAPAQAAPVQQSAADHVGTASPIGQLTTGDSATGEKAKRESADLIGETEQGLNSIKRSLSTEEKVTATQIRTFLKQAKQALEDGDTDGAHSLATRAKLLLDELTKP
jgi:type IV secretory pathway VirB10-like protein